MASLGGKANQISLPMIDSMAQLNDEFLNLGRRYPFCLLSSVFPMPYMMGIDVGTTGTRAVVVRPDGHVVSAATADHQPMALPARLPAFACLTKPIPSCVLPSSGAISEASFNAMKLRHG